MKTKVLVLLAGAIGALVLGGGIVLAGPPNGFASFVLAKGTNPKATEISANRIEFSSPKNAQVIVQRGEFAMGGNTGWHTHPGLTVVTVTAGTLRYHDGCSSHVYTVGQSFVETPNRPGMVENTSANATAQVFASLIVPAGMAPRTDVPAPDCTKPADD
jgi:quercetin dioxygenase-like cupin family protein